MSSKVVGVAVLVAGIVTFNCWPLTNCVAKGVAPSNTLAPVWNLCPDRVIGTACPNASKVAGALAYRKGSGAGALMGSISAFDAPPAVSTLTKTVRAVASSAAGIVAVNVELLVTVAAIKAPSKRILAGDRKYVPDSVMVCD